jgi:hypothetical protein
VRALVEGDVEVLLGIGETMLILGFAEESPQKLSTRGLIHSQHMVELSLEQGLMPPRIAGRGSQPLVQVFQGASMSLGKPLRVLLPLFQELLANLATVLEASILGLSELKAHNALEDDILQAIAFSPDGCHQVPIKP